MYRYFLVVLIVFSFFFEINQVEACSPSSWSYDLLSEESTALIYGRVTDLKNNNRQPTIEVIQYIGPGDAPRVVHLPTTESSIQENDSCPDFSMTFEKEKEYFIFLSTIGNEVKYLKRNNNTTVLEVINGQVLINMQGTKEKVNVVLEKYAAEKELVISYPNALSMTWSNSGLNLKLFLICTLIISVCVLVTGVTFFIVKNRS